MGKGIHWELYKKFKFDLTNKWYMHNPVSVLENETHKILWDFEIQTDHLISARLTDLIIKKNEEKENEKRTGRIVDFVVPANLREKLKESKKISTRTLLENWKKTVEHESDEDTNCNWCSWYSH